MKKILCGNEMDRMPDWAFRIMAFLFNVADFFRSPDNKLDPFCIMKGQTVIDFGSGTGRYLRRASEMVGEEGLVYAVDIQELAVKSAFRIIAKHNLKNVKPVLTDGISAGVPSHVADIVYCLDMFHMVKDTRQFFMDLNRLTKPEGILYLEDGHQPRTSTREKVLESGYWEILEESAKFIKCKPKTH